MLEEKLDTLTKEIVKLRQAIEAGGTTKTAAEPSESPKKPAAKKPTTKKAAEPEHDEDETGAILRKLAKRSEDDKLAVRKYIKSKKVADLAELLTKPELYDDAYAFAEAALESEPDEDEDEDEDDV